MNDYFTKSIVGNVLQAELGYMPDFAPPNEANINYNSNNLNQKNAEFEINMPQQSATMSDEVIPMSANITKQLSPNEQIQESKPAKTSYTYDNKITPNLAKQADAQLPKEQKWYVRVFYFALFIFIMFVVFFAVYQWLIKHASN